MLQDRPYMRDAYEARRTSILTWILCSMAAVFVLQNILVRYFPATGYAFESALALSAGALRAGKVWTLVTYGFLHDTGNLLQIIGYMLAVYFAGREVLPILGQRRFAGFYAAALVAGGLAFTAMHWRAPMPLIGCSAAVWALVILYACFFPNREVTLLLFFMLPVTFKPKHLAYVLVAADLFGFAFYEVLGSVSPFGVMAHSAHLAGMAVGWVYFRYIHEANWLSPSGGALIELPEWVKRAPARSPAPAAYSVNVDGRSHLRAEVDRILDKINSDGFGSLSAEEKRVLDEARDLIGRR
jgi:membrane associated rhomboid family serine protease